MQITNDMSASDLNMFAFSQALEALKALANQQATVIRERDGAEVIGVRWTPPGADCPEQIFWNDK